MNCVINNILNINYSCIEANKEDILSYVVYMYNQLIVGFMYLLNSLDMFVLYLSSIY